MLLVFGFIALTIMVLSGFGRRHLGRSADQRQIRLRSSDPGPASGFGDRPHREFLRPAEALSRRRRPRWSGSPASCSTAGCFGPPWANARSPCWPSSPPFSAMDSLGVLITPLSYDTGLYHLQLIEWLEQAPKVFGLVNLHYRFGVNSIWFVDARDVRRRSSTHAGIFLLNTTCSPSSSAR